MTKTEYRATIERLDLRQVQAAKFLGVDTRTVRSWESGRSPIPQATAKLLRYMVRKGLTPEEVDDV